MNPFAVSVILGGAGAVAQLFAKRLGGSGLTLVDPLVEEQSRAPQTVRLDATSFVERGGLIREADLVILAMPERPTLQVIPRLASLLKQGALLVDTLSVKGPVCELMSGLDAPVELLSINPMFAPDLGFEGRSVAAVEIVSGPASSVFLDLLRGWGARVNLMTADIHDETAARTQALSHAAILALGLALTRQGYDCDAALDDSPPPHRTLMALLARILSGRPETYFDIQSGNPQAQAMTDALYAGVEELRRVLRTGCLEDFSELLREVRQTIGPRQDELAEDCETLFTALGRFNR